MTKPIYAVGDIHGQLGELTRILALIEADGGTDASVVFVGDYIDRGADSCAVLDTLIAGRDAGRDWTFLLGNHDRMFDWWMQDYPVQEAYLPVELYWLHPRLGGDTTLASYGIEFTVKSRQINVHAEARQTVPKAHMEFIAQCKLSHETDELFFCHAGVRPGVALDQQTEHDLIWIREEFHEHTAPHPKLIVHGHTPVEVATHYGNRVNLDTGAGYGKPMTVAVFEGRDCWTLTDKGRVSLKPQG